MTISEQEHLTLADPLFAIAIRWVGRAGCETQLKLCESAAREDQIGDSPCTLLDESSSSGGDKQERARGEGEEDQNE